MNFRKLALASAIAAPAIAMVPLVGHAMTEAEDEYLSGISGQDGLEILVSTASPIGADIYIHDKDGLGAVPISSGYSFGGAVVVEGFSFIGDMAINIDAGDSVVSGPGAPSLNINIGFPAGATIVTGDLKVGNSQRDDAVAGWGVTNLSGVLLNTMTIALAGLSVNMQLGNEPQGSMVAINSTITGGLTINNFKLNDISSGGAIGAAQIVARDNGGTDLHMSVTGDATAAGLVLTLAQLGSSTTGMDISMTDLYLGSPAGLIGDLTIEGLNLNGATLTLSGK